MVINLKDILVVNKFDELLDDVKKIGNKICEIIKRLGRLLKNEVFRECILV